MSDPASMTQLDLSPAMLLGPYGVALACSALQKITNRKPLKVALALSFLTAIVTLGDGALASYEKLGSSALDVILFALKEALLFLFGGFGVFSAALGMNVMSSSGATFGASSPASTASREWNTLWFK